VRRDVNTRLRLVGQFGGRDGAGPYDRHADAAGVCRGGQRAACRLSLSMGSCLEVHKWYAGDAELDVDGRAGDRSRARAAL